VHCPEFALDRGGLALYVVAAVLAAAAQLAAGYLYLTSGLVAPLWALALFLIWWLVLPYVGVKLALRRSCWLLLVPVVAVTTWFGAMAVGGTVLGWSA
jgi:hypothetical protein